MGCVFNMSVNIILYESKSQPNKINKSLNSPLSLSCEITDIINIQSPEILIDFDINAIKKNYVFISDFSRYYFVKSMNIEGNKIRIFLYCDVLMSFKNDILNSEIIARRSSSNYEDYIIDGLIRTTNNTSLHVSRFPYEFIGKPTDNFIMKIGGKL